MDQTEPLDLYDAANLAMAAIQYRPTKRGEWALLVVSSDGKVRTVLGLTDREVRHSLRYTASMLRTERFDTETQTFVADLDPTRAKRPRQGLSPRTRFDVLTRDAFRCRYCGANAPDTILHVDHVTSRKDGGTDDLGNLITACRDCNLGKSSRSAVLPGDTAPGGEG